MSRKHTRKQSPQNEVAADSDRNATKKQSSTFEEHEVSSYGS